MHYIRDNLAVCGFHHIGSREEFASHGFGAQLQCTGAYDPWLTECVEVLATPFDDGIPIPKDLFNQAQGWLGTRWDSGCKILISCAAGKSRSVTMAIALLKQKGGLTFLGATHEVIGRVPEAYPHPYVLASAACFSGEPLQLEDLRSIYESVRSQPRYPWSLDLIDEAARLK